MCPYNYFISKENTFKHIQYVDLWIYSEDKLGMTSVKKEFFTSTNNSQ